MADTKKEKEMEKTNAQGKKAFAKQKDKRRRIGHRVICRNGPASQHTTNFRGCVCRSQRPANRK